MEQLAYLDDHARTVAATPDQTWRALLAVLGGMGGSSGTLPAPLTRAWGLRQPARSGNWNSPGVGDTILGFAVADIDPPRVLTLRGRHRFSDYQLQFNLEPAADDRVDLHARSHADFPGVLGSVYRTLVIGSRAHVLATRRMLAHVARRAERDVVVSAPDENAARRHLGAGDRQKTSAPGHWHTAHGAYRDG